MGNFTWSSYQQDIFEYALDPDKGSFCIEAVAGSGKTTVLVETAKRLATEYPDEKMLFLAFNKSIAEKLKEELAEFSNMTCKTAHSFGLSVLYRSGLKFKVDQYKWKNYIRVNYDRFADKEKELPKKLKETYIDNCVRIFDLCRSVGVKVDLKSIRDLADLCGVLTLSNEVAVVKQLLMRAGNLMTFKIKEDGENVYVIDYNDMVMFPNQDAFRKYIPKFKFVMCDEAQDLTFAQQRLIQNAVKKHGKMIPIGDASQSIYMFATGRENTFDEFKKICGDVTLPLSVCYRCGKNIIKEAQKINPEIIWKDDADDGVVRHTRDMNDIKGGDMVLCRKTKPLVVLALKLISAGVSAYVKGNDIAQKYKHILDNLAVGDYMLGMSDIEILLDQYLDNIRAKLVKMECDNPEFEPAYMDALDDVSSIRIIGKGCKNVYEIMDKIDSIFTDVFTGHAVMLSTVHRAKGLEADNVYIVCPEILPLINQHTNMSQASQELNLKYVAVTRARNVLTYVDVSEKEIDDFEFKFI